MLRESGAHLSFHDPLHQHDRFVVEVDAKRASLRCKLQCEPLGFGRIAGGMLGSDPRRQASSAASAAKDQTDKQPGFNPAASTLDLLLPIVNLGQENAWVPHSWPNHGRGQ